MVANLGRKALLNFGTALAEDILPQLATKIMNGFYYIAFLYYTIAEKTLLDYTILFSANYYKENNKIIDKYSKGKYDQRKHQA